MRILLVEDEAEFAKALRGALSRDRFVVDWVDSVSLASEASRSGVHELILLDRTLPDDDGLALIPQFRVDSPGVPIIVLSASGELSDRVAGLDDGADDYLVKPFDFGEMLACIRAVQRRPNELAPDEINIGDLVFDMAFGEARVRETRLNLQRREVSVLTALLRRRGRAVLRESLEEAVYGTVPFLSSFLGGAIFTPFSEEILFRGVVANALNRYGAFAGIVVSSIIFGLAHGVSVILTIAIMVGILSAVLFRATGSVWPSVVLHSVYNGANSCASAFGLCLRANTVTQ